MAPKKRPEIERFWGHVDKTDSCWLWTRSKINGYGAFKAGPWNAQRGVLAHRYAWEHLRGPIPEGYELDHLCRVRNCVNPEHLEPVLPQVNFLRSMNQSAIAARTNRCIRGHSLADAYRRRDGGRSCRQCRVHRAEEIAAQRKVSELTRLRLQMRTLDALLGDDPERVFSAGEIRLALESARPRRNRQTHVRSIADSESRTA
jgi:hypothetical protein